MALTKSDKMDQAGVRTAADIEQKYNFGKSFAKAMGLAEDARTTAEKAKEAAQAASNIDFEKVFNALTHNGTDECIREFDGHLYINASYVKTGILSADRIDSQGLFAKNINMEGTFTHTTKAFLSPGEPEYEMAYNFWVSESPFPYDLLPLFDFNNDGKFNEDDIIICRNAVAGKYDLSDWAKAKGFETDVTMTMNMQNPEKAITFSGKNIWGREINEYIGINSISISRLNKAYIPTVVNGYGANVGYQLDLNGKVAPLFIRDTANPLNYWYGIYGFKADESYTIQTIFSNGLSASSNNWGTILIEGGNGPFDFYNMIQGIL